MSSKSLIGLIFVELPFGHGQYPASRGQDQKANNSKFVAFALAAHIKLCEIVTVPQFSELLRYTLWENDIPVGNAGEHLWRDGPRHDVQCVLGQPVPTNSASDRCTRR